MSNGETAMKQDECSESTDSIKTLRKSRGVFKRKLTLLFKQLKDLKESNRLTFTLRKSLMDKINIERAQVTHYDNRINTLMILQDMEVTDGDFYTSELEDQASYSLQIELELDNYANVTEHSEAQSVVTSKDLLEVMAHMNVSEGKLPSLDCSTFSGKEKDKFAFNTFFNQFKNVIGSRKNLSDANKLTYLVGCLRDYALSVVKHLSITDDNYEIAIQMLEREFLDKEFIIDETYKNILKSSPSSTFDSEYTPIKIYLNEIRSYLLS